MIKSLIVENYNGDEITITMNDPEPEHGLIIKSITGIGAPKGTINMSDYAMLDGSKTNSTRAEKRNILITFLFATSDQCPTIEAARHNSYKYFQVKKKVTLSFITDERMCQISGYVESNEPEIFSDMESCQISILCENPYFVRLGENYFPQRTIFYDVVSDFEFPFENNSLTENLIEISHYSKTIERHLFYEGDAETGMLVKIHVLKAGIGNLIFYSFIPQETMWINVSKIEAIVGSPIRAGDDIFISTVKGEQYARFYRDTITYNILNAVDRNSAWIQLATGDNVLALVTDNETEPFLEVEIENKVYYEGV